MISEQNPAHVLIITLAYLEVIVYIRPSTVCLFVSNQPRALIVIHLHCRIYLSSFIGSAFHLIES